MTWNYDHLKTPRAYGPKVTYHNALRWLQVCPAIEDWGCGPGYFGTILPGTVRYFGLDGAVSQWGSKVPIDLATYKSNIPGIMMRHVLEHNMSWRTILANALESFTQRMCLILFVPPIDGIEAVNYSKDDTPILALPSLAIDSMVAPYLVTSHRIKTKSPYGYETIYYLEK